VVPHGHVVHLIDLVKRAGVRKFAINVDAAYQSGAVMPAQPGGAAPGATPTP
jgi:hypothetical protein